jgi:hypothetical protein
MAENAVINLMSSVLNTRAIFLLMTYWSDFRLSFLAKIPLHNAVSPASPKKINLILAPRLNLHAPS